MLSVPSKISARAKTISKIALGSANFGCDYGLANHAGKVSNTELEKILSLSKEVGIEVIDTAQAYGDSESRIGTLCGDGRFKIVTKIGVDLERNFKTDTINSFVKQSCKRLNQSHIFAVLVHRPEALLGGNGRKIIKELLTLKEERVVSKIGISVYSPLILGEISKLMQLDIVQAPFNIFDQQILSSGWGQRLKANGTEIHTRSTFLQGLLLMKRSNLPRYFSSNWPDLFNSWYEFLRTNGVDALNVALNFVLKQNWIDKVVVGVDSASQLRSIVEIETSLECMDFPQLGCDDANLINPSKWNLN